jgi:hypothetical protein
MADGESLPLLDHELEDDEIAWMEAVYEDFRDARPRFGDPKEALRYVLAMDQHQLPAPMDLTGPGPWRGGRNRHGRNVTAVFLPRAELHRHARSRTDQFAMYVVGEAEGFCLDHDGKPVLSPVTGGGHFHNPPDAPHAFVPKVGQPVPDDWEISFIAITPRNLRDDTQSVSAEVKAAYTQATGREAPTYV